MKTLYNLIGALLLGLTSIAVAGCEDYTDSLDISGKWVNVAENGQIFDGGYETWTFQQDGTFVYETGGCGPDSHVSTYEGKYEQNSDKIKFWYPVKDENGETSLQMILECKISRHADDIIKMELVYRLTGCPEWTYRDGVTPLPNPLWPGNETEQFFTQHPERYNGLNK